MQVNII